MPMTSTNRVSSSRLKTSAARLTRRKRTGLAVRSVAARVEGPVTVENKVVENRNQPGGNGGGPVVDAHGVHEQGVDGEVHDEPDGAHDPEADQLQPVGGAPHSVKETDVRPDLHGGGLLAHHVRVAARAGGCSR